MAHVREPVPGCCRGATAATGSHLIFKDVQSHRVLALVLAAPWDAFGCVEEGAAHHARSIGAPQPTAAMPRLALTLVLQALLVLLGVVRGWLCLCLSLLPGKG